MRKKIYILIALILLIGCEDNSKNIKGQNHNIEQKNAKSDLKSHKIAEFRLKDLNNKTINIIVYDSGYRFENIDKKIVLINFFATWCPPCIGEIPHLKSLKRKYRDKIEILGVLLYDNELKVGDLNRFKKYQRINFFISNSFEENSKFAHFIAPKLRLKKEFSIPLTLMFVDGKYFTHYEGSVPEEMIESDIKQAIIKLRGE